MNTDQLQWNTDIENTLNRFPILLRINEWMKGTNFHHQPGEIGWERMALSHVLQITAYLQRSTTDVDGNVTTVLAKSRKNDLVQLCSDYVCVDTGKPISSFVWRRRGMNVVDSVQQTQPIEETPNREMFDNMMDSIFPRKR